MVKNTGKKTVVVRSLKAVRDTALGYLFVYQWYSDQIPGHDHHSRASNVHCADLRF